MAAAALLAAAGRGALAQDYPSRPVSMVVAAAAGGPIDVFTRIMAERMSPILGQRVVVENVGGGGGTLGGQRVAKAEPDGYTTLLGTIATHANPQLYGDKPLYDPLNDFVPVALIAEIPLVVIARKDFPANTFEEFMAYAKANPGKLNYGSAGVGSASHLGCVMLDQAMGTNAPARAVPRHRAGDAGSDRRADRFSLRHRGDGGAEHQGRHGEGARQRCRGRRIGGAARSADRGGKRTAVASRPTPGPRCSCRRARRRRSRPSSTRRRWRR